MSRPAWVNTVRIDPVPRDLFAQRIQAMLDCGRSHVVHFVPADPTVIARRDPGYRETLNGGDLNVPDGMAVVWALRLQGRRSERIAGSDAMALLTRWGAPNGVRHYLFGGAQATLDSLQDGLKGRIPGIALAGSESPPFRPLRDDEVLEAALRIRASRADLVWIGLGTPKQDLIAQRFAEVNAAPVILCVGAAFDFLAGTKARAPQWMQRSGLEWVHRLVTEPRRLWKRYLVGNPQFVLAVLGDRLGGRRRNGAS
jgi:N-acetylglucosaminyldiphosphoundecaprenol N-acetyl-beta-D-mannosaminyltransferase